MGMKYNLSGLKNHRVRFISVDEKDVYRYEGVVTQIKNNKKGCRIGFENGKIMEVSNEILSSLIIREENGVILCIYQSNNSIKSGLIGFSLYETYGFPIELTNEILIEKGIDIDMEGFWILCKLQKEMSNGTFKQVNAF